MTHPERLAALRLADELLDSARAVVARHASPDGTLDEPHSRGRHLNRVRAAAVLYRRVGLGLLASRLDWLADTVTYHDGNVVDEWAFFDRLNAGGCGVA
jgi:hypothetical protein